MKLDPTFKPRSVLCVAAHPDDLEFSVAGSVACWCSEGAEVNYLICTNGANGSTDRTLSQQKLVETRQNEQRMAAKILGVKEVVFFDYEDGSVEVTMKLKKDITREIRRFNPDVVFCMDPTLLYIPDRWFINHPDHRAVGQATVDAVYPMARDHLMFPELLDLGYEPHKVRTLLLSNFEKSNFAIDITSEFPTKIKALAAHESQIPDLLATEQMLKAWAKDAGKLVGVKYAEAFVRVDLPG
ncbi:MAG: PIG-L deacetylase family protein [Candidatus Saccharimonadia bacterium]